MRSVNAAVNENLFSNDVIVVEIDLEKVDLVKLVLLS
jgi:hypothetical protein